MGFDSPAGLQGLKPSGPLSNPRSDLLGPRLLISLSALSDACRAPVVSGFEFVMDFEVQHPSTAVRAFSERGLHILGWDRGVRATV